MDDLLKEICQCKLCALHLPNEPRPILSASPKSKIAIIGHSPGRVVHKLGTPWGDASGDRLRSWMVLPKNNFIKRIILPLYQWVFATLEPVNQATYHLEKNVLLNGMNKSFYDVQNYNWSS